MARRPRLLLLWLAACAGFDALLAWLLGWSFGRAVVLLPIVVMVAGAIGFLVVLWTRVAWESVRTNRHH
jgi:hypothetical protein